MEFGVWGLGFGVWGLEDADKEPARARDSHTMKDVTVMKMITGMKRALTASAERCVGGFEA